MKKLLLAIIVAAPAVSQACPVIKNGPEYDSQIALVRVEASIFVASVPYSKDVRLGLTYVPKSITARDKGVQYISIRIKRHEELLYSRFIVNPPEGYRAEVVATWAAPSPGECSARGRRVIDDA